MQLAVISDMHGNCFALDHVLADIRQQGIDQIVCLGDAIQGGAQPAQTLKRLRELNCPVVLGNADAWLLTGEETSPHEQTNEQQLAVRAWSLAQLSESDITFMQQFLPTIEMQLDAGQKLLCFHGSPHSFDDIILPTTPDDTVRQFLGGYDATLLTGGHTHTQQLRRIGNAWYFNPGSISLAYNWERSKEQLRVDPWADYAIISAEGANFGITFRHVPFDVDELAHIIRASGRPYAEEAIIMYR
ncbi:MAG: metallophosphatase family protein [Chloroflexota bacterium]|nr:metallophosphatase family protein [Chloroflexota bacterium]